MNMVRTIALPASLILLSVAAAGQTKSYPSPTPPTCTPPLDMEAVSGGYACVVRGWFPWYAAGGTGQVWTSTVTLSAPGNEQMFQGTKFNDQGGQTPVVTTVDSNGATQEQNIGYGSVLSANQPYQITIQGLSSEQSSGFPTQQTGPVFVSIACPDSTCLDARPQLNFIAFQGSSAPYFNLSIPAIWNSELGDRFSAVYRVTLAGPGWQENGSWAIVNGGSTDVGPQVCLFDHTGQTQIACKQMDPIKPNGAGALDLKSGFGSALAPAGFTGNEETIKAVFIAPAGSRIGVAAIQFNGLAATSIPVQPEPEPGQ